VPGWSHKLLHTRKEIYEREGIDRQWDAVLADLIDKDERGLRVDLRCKIEQLAKEFRTTVYSPIGSLAEELDVIDAEPFLEELAELFGDRP
jgi:hypothetical protein